MARPLRKRIADSLSAVAGWLLDAANRIDPPKPLTSQVIVPVDAYQDMMALQRAIRVAKADGNEAQVAVLAARYEEAASRIVVMPRG